MLEVYFGIFVIEDSILDNLFDIERDILNYRIIEQGPLGHHFTHIGHQDEMGCDEGMPYLGDVGQILALKCIACRSLFTFHSPWPFVSILRTMG